MQGAGQAACGFAWKVDPAFEASANSGCWALVVTFGLSEPPQGVPLGRCTPSWDLNRLREHLSGVAPAADLGAARRPEV